MEVSTPLKLNIGAGDCPNVNGKLLEKKRTPVLSARRFYTRPKNVTPRYETKIANTLEELTKVEKTEIEIENKAITNVNENKEEKGKNVFLKTINITPRKRSLTLAEITPSRTYKNNNKTLCSGVVRTRRNDAGRPSAADRVFHQLLLNAWRRRRSDVATLTDSRHRLTNQVQQLEMQVSVLQALRENESCKRSEASMLNGTLQAQLREKEQEFENEKQGHEETKRALESANEKLENIKSQLQNVSNELKYMQDEANSYEKQLIKERKKLSDVKEQKENTMKKVLDYSQEIDRQNVLVREFEVKLAETKKELDLSNLNNEELNIENENLEKKIKALQYTKKDLQEKLDIEMEKYDNSQKKITSLKHIISSLKTAKKKLAEENADLTMRLKNVLFDIEEQTSKTWWKQAKTFILSSIQNSVYLMLPAIPPNFSFKCPPCQAHPYLKYI